MGRGRPPQDPDIEALKKQLASQSRRLEEIENQIYAHMGTDSGNVGYNYPHPYLWPDKALDIQTGELDVANTADETTLYSFTLPPGTLDNRSVRLSLYGDWLNNTGGNENIRLRAKFGSTTMVDTGDIAIGFDAARRFWQWEILISADNSTAAQQLAWFLFTTNASTATTGTGAVGLTASPNGGYLGTAAENATLSLPITVTVDWTTASANLSWRRQYASLELVKQRDLRGRG